MLFSKNKVVGYILTMLLLGTVSPFVASVMAADPVFQTTAEATAAATKLGYMKINELSSGQAVYKRGNDYITRDIDGHNGGAWKRASSVANLGSKTTRTGTYSADLTQRIGD
jgi:filamentous hemagglutinin